MAKEYQEADTVKGNPFSFFPFFAWRNCTNIYNSMVKQGAQEQGQDAGGERNHLRVMGAS